jgi:hypothetical protein
MTSEADLKHKRHTLGVVATLAFHCLMAFVLYTVTLRIPPPPAQELTVLIDPGEEAVTPPPPPAPAKEKESAEARNPAPAEVVKRGVPANQVLPDKAPNDIAQKTTVGYATDKGDVERTIPEPPKEIIDPRALFTAGGEYPEPDERGTGTANQGSRSGNSDHGAMASGTGSDLAYYLTDRKIVGTPPRPEHTENIPSREGVVVVVEVWVNEKGNVTRANPGVSTDKNRTNTSNPNLWEAAKKAALGTKFTPTTTPSQYGHIVYRFRWE